MSGIDWSPITDVEEARRIAREWQSPGSIGHILAAFASGRTVDRWRLHDDAQQTQRHTPGMDLTDWADLDRLRDWCKDNDEGYLSGPHGQMRIITNNVPRDVLRWDQLTDAERDDLGYGTDTRYVEDRWFVRYKGNAIDLTDLDGLTTGELARKGWESYASDSFFSGLVFRYDTDYEQVVVGRYIV